MHGEYGKSIGPKLCLAVVHASSIAITAWILFASQTIPLVAGTLPYAEPQLGFIPKLILLLCSVGYFARLCITGYVFLHRTIRWDEGLGITLLLLLLHPGFALLARVSGTPLSVVAALGVALYAAGSFLNTYSEFQRYHWKQQHPGSLYTQGLFRWSMHINYFGDVVLFTGFALVTGSLFALIVPVMMAIFFGLYHIPRLDRHLARHGDSFWEWEARTPKLIPYVY